MKEHAIEFVRWLKENCEMYIDYYTYQGLIREIDELYTFFLVDKINK